MLAGDGRGGAREELVPGGKAGALAVDPEGQLGSYLVAKVMSG